VSRALRVPCAACLTSAAVELVLPKRKRYDKTQTVLADFPEAKRAARRDTGAPTRNAARPTKRNALTMHDVRTTYCLHQRAACLLDEIQPVTRI
jgi:hypothetical protein